MTTRVWQGPCIVVGSKWADLSKAQRDEMRELCRCHGFDPYDVRAVEFDVLDCPALIFETYELDAGGQKFAVPGGSVATRRTEVALRGELPAWWLPELGPGW